jgi:3-oxoacyl-[acyl-carrier-protein] synthase-3
MDVYINDMAAFLPNGPVDNDRIEEVLGRIHNIPSRVKKIVLRNNGIQTRYYAIDPETGELTHNNAQLAAEAVRRLEPHPDFSLEAIQCLACGTSCGDLLLPGHALMVLGELGISQCEAVTTHGICISGMTALKYAFMNVMSGISDNAVATGSELASSFMRSRFFSEGQRADSDIARRPTLAFDSDFLRWMLSDGSGAAYLSNSPNPDAVSLRLEWMENVSYAGRLQTCQYAGGVKKGDGSVVGWRMLESLSEEEYKHIFAVKQDIKLLDREIVRTAIDSALLDVVSKHGLTPESIDWFLPHYSSHYFQDKFYQRMKEVGFEIPEDKWFTNLYSTGNTGSAAIYIIMEELLHSGKLKKGQKLLCFIPESGRFSHCYMMLTVV